MNPFFQSLGNVFVFAVFGALFVVLNVSILARLLRPKKFEPGKETTYECGEPPIGSSWVRFDMRFYSVALVFLIFDVEVAVMYPWARVFRTLAQAEGVARWFIFLEMFFFVLVLGVGLVHVWKKGDLDWVKDVSAEGERPSGGGERAAEAHRGAASAGAGARG